MLAEARSKLCLRNINFHYGAKHILKDVSFEIQEHQITTIIGPSGCGKTTLLRILNRLHDYSENARFTGDVLLDGYNIYSPQALATGIRRRIGMVFQKPNPFPMSIFDNVAYGPRILGTRDIRVLQDIVMSSLQAAALWSEVKDELNKSGRQLSEGQQQRLCIARALAIAPEVLLLDEPCSALDPAATESIERLLLSLKSKYTIVVVTHGLGQARRISDWLAFLLYGQMIEFGNAEKILSHPDDPRTFDYLAGRFG